MDSGIKTARSDDARSTASGNWAQAAPESDPSSRNVGGDAGTDRAEFDRLRQREAQIMSLIGCKNPDRLMHDLRNVLNELQLLRMLADTDKP